MKQFHFRAVVNYSCRSSSVSSNCSVKVATDAQSDGRVSLMDCDELPAERYHLDFTPRYQNMRYDDISRTLIISGNSTKMEGDYHVAILALSTID